ncbi:MAG: hypothetical protein PHO94_04510 [Petrimonas sp.]|nr:hypothetical protein [Petrimonas sp.]
MPPTSNTKVYVDPLVNVNYAGFYIHGFYQKFGVKNVIFTNKPFRSLENRKNCLNFVIDHKKYCIDFGGTSDVKPREYAWCDVYGHVNANRKNTSAEYQQKLVSLAPSFGIKLWSHVDSFVYAWKNMWKTFYKVFPFKFIVDYRKQCRYRVYYEEYENPAPEVDKNYIFHLSSVWPNDDWEKNDPGFNEANSAFIAACNAIPDLNFDGGLTFSKNVNCNPSLTQFKCEGSVSVKEYLEKTRRSVLAFNTPFSNGSHGWKLSEFMALGKAIVSLPLVNDLPEPLTHGENVHFVEYNEAAIKEAILKIRNDDEYRTKLEKGARKYWETYGTSTKSLELLGIK